MWIDDQCCPVFCRFFSRKSLSAFLRFSLAASIRGFSDMLESPQACLEACLEASLTCPIALVARRAQAVPSCSQTCQLCDMIAVISGIFVGGKSRFLSKITEIAKHLSPTVVLSLILTHYRLSMPFGNIKIYFRGTF